MNMEMEIKYKCMVYGVFSNEYDSDYDEWDENDLKYPLYRFEIVNKGEGVDVDEGKFREFVYNFGKHGASRDQLGGVSDDEDEIDVLAFNCVSERKPITVDEAHKLIMDIYHKNIHI